MPDSETAATAAFDAGIAEHKRREQDAFTGVFGKMPAEASELLNGIWLHLFDVLLSHYSDGEACSLLTEHEPRSGFRKVTPVAGDVALAMDLLRMIQSAMRLSGNEYWKIMFGMREVNRPGFSRHLRASV